MSDSCPICLDLLSEGKVLPCNHAFHASCIDPWLNKKGSCALCRFQVCPCSEDDEEEVLDIDLIRAAVLEYWRRRYPSLQSLEDMRSLEEPVHSLYREPFQHQDYQHRIRIIGETETEWVYEVDGVTVRTLKTDVSLVQHQTEAQIPTCLYALHKYKGDIVNAILDISGSM